MGAGWWLRTARAAVFAAACVLLTTLGHVMMSGLAVPWWVPVAGAAAVGGPAWVLAGRERRPLAVGLFALGAQAALHTALSLAPHAPRPAAPAGQAMPGMDMDMGAGMAHAGVSPVVMDHHLAVHHAAAGHVLPSHSPLPAGAMDHVSAGGAGMLAAHVLAALLCALWLGCGERAAFRILRAFAALLVAPFRLPLHPPGAVPHRPRVRARRPGQIRVPRPLLLTGGLTFRGPPAEPAVR